MQSNLEVRIKNLYSKVMTRLSSEYQDAIESNTQQFQPKQKKRINAAFAVTVWPWYVTVEHINLNDTKYLFRFPLLSADVYCLKT
jgi:hypothetical protein